MKMTKGPLSNAYKRQYILQRSKPNYTKDEIKNYIKEKFKFYDFLPGCEVGDYTYGLPEIFWYGECANLIIGKFCSIAKDVNIFLGGEHHLDFVTSYPFSVYPFDWLSIKNIKKLDFRPSKGNVEIGNDVWIGSSATILSGVKIGDGAVIGAHALVCKDVAPYTIYGGNPARFLKNRFNQKHIDELLKIKWWDWPKEKIDTAIPYLLSNDIEKFINISNGEL